MSGSAGHFVGLSVGRLTLPDMGPSSGINRLERKCRECRVSSPGESSSELENARCNLFASEIFPNLLIRLDLNDARP